MISTINEVIETCKDGEMGFRACGLTLNKFYIVRRACDYKAGKIKRKEYERRKDEIGDRSLIY
ncbi:MAG: hypothetical protein ACREXR_12965 [Gammaproteobacteria bacterium]